MRSTVIVTTPALVNDDDDDGPPPLSTVAPRPLALAPPPLAEVSLHFKSLPTPSTLSGQDKTKRGAIVRVRVKLGDVC